MAGGAKFRANPGLLDELKHKTVSQREKVARQIVDIARGSAPIDTGRYAGGMGVETNGDQVLVVDSDPNSIYKEYGTSDTPAHATLTDAARQFGKYSGWVPKGRTRSGGLGAARDPHTGRFVKRT